MNQHSPNWGNQAYSYIQALTSGIAALERALSTYSTPEKYLGSLLKTRLLKQTQTVHSLPKHLSEVLYLFSTIAFWSTINDPQTIKSFYDKSMPSRLTLSKIVSAFMNESAFAEMLLQEYWRKNCKGISFKTLIKHGLTKAPVLQYPEISVPIVYVYHQKHVFVAERLKDKFPHLHAICRSEDIKINLPIIRLPKPTIKDLDRFMKQFPYPVNIAWQYCAMQALLKKIKIEKLLMIEGTSPIEIATVLAAKSFQTICVQYGWPPYLHAGFRNLPYDSFWCWGKGFQEKLALYNPKATFFIEGYHSQHYPVSVVARKKHDFHLLVALQGPVGYIQPKDWSLFLDLINKLSELSIDVWVKEHPQIQVENLKTLQNVTIYRGDGSVQQALLKEADAVLGIYSSTMVEAPLFNCIPIIFNPTEIPSIYSEITEHQVGIECRTTQAVLDAIENLLLPENRKPYLKNMGSFRARFFNERI